MREVKVQGSSSVYTVKIADNGEAVCYQDNGQLCIGWKNSKAPKTCKHVRLALAGRTITPAAAVEVETARFSGGKTTETVAKPIEPMLASKMESAVISDWTSWAIEEKFDGHRAMVSVSKGEVTAWSRSGKGRELPSQVRMAFSVQPDGIYDGELMGREGGSFADVRRIENQDSAYFVVFDVVDYAGENTRGLRYDDRREILVHAVKPSKFVRVADSRNLESQADVVAFVSAVWERGGEGAILKRRAAKYQAGRRSPDFVKVKKGGSRVVVVRGFKPGERGPCSSIVCEDPEDGMMTAVKNESKIDASAKDIGRRLWIDYTEKTDEAFVNPHCDRWEDR